MGFLFWELCPVNWRIWKRHKDSKNTLQGEERKRAAISDDGGDCGYFSCRMEDAEMPV